MNTCSSNSWLVWASQVSGLTKLTPKLVCMSSHQARKLLLIPYPLLSVHVYGIICSFIGHFPWSSHELISPEQASQPRREIFNSEAQLLRKKQLPYFFHSFMKATLHKNIDYVTPLSGHRSICVPA